MALINSRVQRFSLNLRIKTETGCLAAGTAPAVGRGSERAAPRRTRSSGRRGNRESLAAQVNRPEQRRQAGLDLAEQLRPRREYAGEELDRRRLGDPSHLERASAGRSVAGRVGQARFPEPATTQDARIARAA